MPAAKNKVRIADSRSVMVGDRLRSAGEVVEVSARDAKSLIAEGWAEDPTTPKPEPEREEREDDSTRKPLTVEALEAGEGERG